MLKLFTWSLSFNDDVISMRTYIGIAIFGLWKSYCFVVLFWICEIGVGFLIHPVSIFTTGNGFFVFFTAIFGSGHLVAFIYGLIKDFIFNKMEMF